HAAANLDAISHKILHETPPPLARFRSDVPHIFQRIVDRCLAKDPAQRYRSGMDLAGDLNLVGDFILPRGPEPSRQEKFGALRALEFFREFPDHELWELLNASTWQQVAAGEPILVEGDLDKSFYVLVEGTVSVSKGRRSVDTLHAGAFFGYMGFISGNRCSVSITAYIL